MKIKAWDLFQRWVVGDRNLVYMAGQLTRFKTAAWEEQIKIGDCLISVANWRVNNE
jgi:hypothetical protein